MTTFALYPIEKVRPHPKNVRRVAKASPEMVESIRAQGVLEPVILGPEDADGIRYLIAGNVRHHGAVEAGLTTLPAVLRDDLVTDAQQIEAMLVENLHRSDLTADEEADAYVQLELFGMDDQAIAAATGRSVKTIKARKRLTGLPAEARTKLHEGQATLGDVEKLLEFAGNPDVLAELTDELGGKDFNWRIQREKDRRDRVTRNKALIEEFGALGAVEVDNPSEGTRLGWYSTSDPRRDPASHEGCLGYVSYGDDSHSEPRLVCLDASLHDEKDNAEAAEAEERRAEQQAAWEAQNEARRAAEASRLAAAKVRVAHTSGVIAGILRRGEKRGATTELAGLIGAFLPYTLADPMIEELVDARVLGQALGLGAAFDEGDGGLTWGEYRDALQEHARTLSESHSSTDLVSALAGFLAALLEMALTKPADWPSETTAWERVVAGRSWEWLASTGYELSSVEEEIRDKAMYSDPADEDAE